MKKSLTYAFVRKIFSVGCLALMGFAAPVYAQTDTLVVRGKIENLTFRLYRQAPEISVARVNILQPTREIVKVVQLKPDGSFELKMPLIFPKEECYLSYSSVVMPFLAAKGTVEVTIFADSLNKTDIPLQFGGLHAATNNQHAQFYVAFNKWVEENNLFRTPTTLKKTLGVWQTLRTERDQKWALYGYYRAAGWEALKAYIEKWQDKLLDYNAKQRLLSYLFLYPLPSPSTNPTLDNWVKTSIDEQAKAQLFTFLAQPPLATIPAELMDSLKLDTTNLLTFAKADCYQQFSNHIITTTPQTSQLSLSINKLSSLILAYVPDLTQEDSLKLKGFIDGGSAKMKDLKYLNTLFMKKQDTLKLISTYELYLKKYSAVCSAAELEYMKPVFYIGSLPNFAYHKMVQWYNYIRPTLQNPYYARSLDEIHALESSDSAAISQAYALLNFPKLEELSGDYSEEIFPSGFIYRKTQMSGNEIWQEIKQKSKGKATYFIFWTNDELGRSALAEARQFQATLPKEQLNFVYLCEYKSPESVWIETVVRSKSRGLHIKLEDEQNDYFVNEWGINRVPFCVLIDANGKYIKRDAPLPSDREGWDKIWNKVFGK
jgi:hypothetical protein